MGPIEEGARGYALLYSDGWVELRVYRHPGGGRQRHALRARELRVSSAKLISQRAVCANAPPRISSTTRYRMLRPRTANWGGPSQISHSLGEIPAQICTTQDPLSLGFEPRPMMRCNRSKFVTCHTISLLDLRQSSTLQPSTSPRNQPHLLKQRDKCSGRRRLESAFLK